MEKVQKYKNGVQLRQDARWQRKKKPYRLGTLEWYGYENRRDLTPAEAAMELLLKDLGWRFTIEHPRHNQNIICDFFVPEHKLFIEVDGPYHERQKGKDQARDRALAKQGMRVRRFTNDQVLRFPRRTKATLLAIV